MSEIIFKKLTVQEKKEIKAGKSRLKTPVIAGDKFLGLRPIEGTHCRKVDD
ncbi:MAG: hypothetical protein GY757_20950 [bacterium]|nr:hypothetical protein [bacterium]